MKFQMKAVLLLSGIETIIMGVLITFSITYMYHISIEQLQERADDTLVLIATAVGESLFISNLNSVQEIIDTAFHDIDNIDYIKVVCDEGRTLAERRKGHDLVLGRQLVSKRNIELGSVVFGTLYMHFSIQSCIDKVKEQLFVMILFAIIGLIISIISIWVASGKIVAIFEKIAAGLTTLVTSETPVEFHSTHFPELNKVVYAYNRLINQIHPN